MLIDSPRLTPGDRRVWARLERYDRALAHSRRMDDLEARAVDMIRGWAASRRGYVGVSWGKDSTVVAHLCHLAGIGWPLVWLRAGRWDNPDCVAVRDAFLGRWPSDYHEYGMDEERLVLRHRGDEGHTGGAWADALRAVAGRFGAHRVTGVRADESSARRMSAGVHGAATDVSCRPILSWTGVDVFAYLARHDLPVHPAYAMTFSGSRDRVRVRVGSIGGEAGEFVGRARWEETYYRDVLDGGRAT